MPAAEGGLAARLLAPAHRVTLEDLPGVWFHTIATVRCPGAGPLAAPQSCCSKVPLGPLLPLLALGRTCTPAPTPASAWASPVVAESARRGREGDTTGLACTSAGSVFAVLLMRNDQALWSASERSSRFWRN